MTQHGKNKKSFEQTLNESDPTRYREPLSSELKKAALPDDRHTFLKPEHGQVALTSPPNSVNMRQYDRGENRPLIGAEGLHENLALILYNPARRKVLIANQKTISDDELSGFLRMIRMGPVQNINVQNPETVEAHVVGCPKSEHGGRIDTPSLIKFEEQQKRDERAKRTHGKLSAYNTTVTMGAYSRMSEIKVDTKSVNYRRFHSLRLLFDALSEDKDVEIKTFDVYDALKPHAVAFDRKNKELVQGSALWRSEEEARTDIIENKENALTPFSGSAPYVPPPEVQHGGNGNHAAKIKLGSKGHGNGKKRPSERQ